MATIEALLNLDNRIWDTGEMKLEREHGNNGQAGDALGRTRSHLHEAPRQSTGKSHWVKRGKAPWSCTHGKPCEIGGGVYI